MIGAIGIKLSETRMARLYLAGTYSSINWNSECPSELGEGIVSYCLRDDVEQLQTVYITKGLNGEYVLRLIETKRYIVKVESDGVMPGLPRFQNEGNKLLKIDKDKDSVTFQFINYLGRSKLYFPDSPVSLSFEVIPDKMDYEDDYICLTEALGDICSELLLDYAGSTSNVFRQSEADKKTLLEQFIFLRKFCFEDNLQGLFEAIKSNSDRVLDQEEELKPVAIGAPSKRFYRNPFSYGKGWMNYPSHGSAKGVYMPQLIAVSRKYDSLDTQANRFVKYALHRFDSVCTDLINALYSDNQGMQAECVEEAKAIHNSLESIFRDTFFDEIGELDRMPQNNQVLQKREGYAQVFAAYSMLDLALQLDWKGKDDVYEGESKNVALLYEYWLFFELYRIIKSIEGCAIVKTEKNPFLMVEDGITISLEEGKESCQLFEIKNLGVKINLYYNRTFSREKFETTRYEGSYSRPFRPDYTLAVFPDIYMSGAFNGEEEAALNGAVSLVHFDAKYRITELTAVFGGKEIESDSDEISDDKTGSVINTYKRGDLLKMHTYNDAIRQTVGSYVLYPGSFHKGSGGNETFRLYDEILPGVGAFSIKPSIGILGEKELKSFIISVIKARQEKNSRLNRLKYYTEMIISEPAVSRRHLVASSEEKIMAGDMFVMGYIRGDSENDYYNFLKKRGFLRKGAEFPFYFYAIKGNNVYSHHKDLFKYRFFRFYKNRIEVTKSYKMEPFLCKVLSNELISKTELVKRLNELGFVTEEDSHRVDFYYVLTLRVIDDQFAEDELKKSEVDSQNGNDSFSPHSPKVICY